MLQIKIKVLRGKVSPDLVDDYPIWRQFAREAGLGNSLYISVSDFDKIEKAAEKHDYRFYW